MKQPPPDPPPQANPKLGEIRHDERGQAVWHWAVDTARNAINSTSQLLKKLDLSNLELEDEHSPPAAGAGDAESSPPPPPLELAPSDDAKATRKRGAAAGFDPYSAKPVTPVRTTQRIRPEELVSRPARKPPRPVSAAPRPSWWRRLLGRD